MFTMPHMRAQAAAQLAVVALTARDLVGVSPSLDRATCSTTKPGQMKVATPGSSWFGVPPYKTFTADISGAGGSGSGNGVSGQPGGDTSFTGPSSGLTAHGGGGATLSAAGAPGTATGGTTNTTGGGAAGGPAGTGGYAGAPGGRAQSTWNAGAPGAPKPGEVWIVVVGAAGVTPGVSQGSNGTLSLSWT
jgi:hypothetical protein